MEFLVVQQKQIDDFKYEWQIPEDRHFSGICQVENDYLIKTILRT